MSSSLYRRKKETLILGEESEDDLRWDLMCHKLRDEQVPFFVELQFVVGVVVTTVECSNNNVSDFLEFKLEWNRRAEFNFVDYERSPWKDFRVIHWAFFDVLKYEIGWDTRWIEVKYKENLLWLRDFVWTLLSIFGEGNFVCVSTNNNMLTHWDRRTLTRTLWKDHTSISEVNCQPILAPALSSAERNRFFVSQRVLLIPANCSMSARLSHECMYLPAIIQRINTKIARLVLTCRWRAERWCPDGYSNMKSFPDQLLCRFENAILLTCMVITSNKLERPELAVVTHFTFHFKPAQ